MKCKNCSHAMFHPGGDAIEWACSWCGHVEWFASWLAQHPRNPTPRAVDLAYVPEILCVEHYDVGGGCSCGKHNQPSR